MTKVVWPGSGFRGKTLQQRAGNSLPSTKLPALTSRHWNVANKAKDIN